MAGKGMVFILALFVVIQTIHAIVNLNAFECPSIFSLKVGVEENECTQKADCRHFRRVCCENQEKVNVCAEGVYVGSTNNHDATTTVSSEESDDVTDNYYDVDEVYNR